ncbi:PEP-CTERM sorting domain-containing protein [Massilia sp. erpn]|uniref:PEP-CTERM sorting domain-containing protein n=1 Tax=Massilia sp. erpn TaxID=2738142 RepID=UPI0021080478|nr:PEP-CTERM sorting domain-containing protein [Massilia sp. erpn]
MRKVQKILLAAVLTCSASGVFAQDINAKAFSLSNAGGWWNGNIQLVSDANGKTVISMGDGPCCSETGEVGPAFSTGDNGWQYYNVNTHAGYRITGFTISAKLNGSLFAGEYEGSRGVAENSGGFEFTAYQGGSTLLTRRWTQMQLQGVETHQVSGQANLPSSFSLDVGAWQAARAEGVSFPYCSPFDCYDRWGAYSSASLKVSDLTLTVHTAPVPEPETYAMLLGGLALTGFLARRRQRKAQQPA